jgi:PiT family inorganic phosphate transporter
MGLIMLILIGTVPMAYALNRAIPADQTTAFVVLAEATQQGLQRSAQGSAPADPRPVLSEYIRTHEVKPAVVPSLAALTGSIGAEVKSYGSLARCPPRPWPTCATTCTWLPRPSA